MAAQNDSSLTPADLLVALGLRLDIRAARARHHDTTGTFVYTLDDDAELLDREGDAEPSSRSWTRVYWPLIEHLWKRGHILWACVGHFTYGSRHARDARRHFTYYLGSSFTPRAHPAAFARAYSRISFFADYRLIAEEVLLPTTPVVESIGPAFLHIALSQQAQDDQRALREALRAHPEAYIQGHEEYFHDWASEYAVARALLERGALSALGLPASLPDGRPRPPAWSAHPAANQIAASAYADSLRSLAAESFQTADGLQGYADTFRERVDSSLGLSRERLGAYLLWMADTVYPSEAGQIITICGPRPHRELDGATATTAALVLVTPATNLLPLKELPSLHAAFRLGSSTFASQTGREEGRRELLDSFGHETSKILRGLQYLVASTPLPAAVGDTNTSQGVSQSHRDSPPKENWLDIATRTLMLWSFARDEDGPISDTSTTSFEALIHTCWQGAISMELTHELYDIKPDSRHVADTIAAFVARHSELPVIECRAQLRPSWGHQEKRKRATRALARALICLLANSVRHGTARPDIRLSFQAPHFRIDIATPSPRPTERSKAPHFSSFDVARLALHDISGELAEPQYHEGLHVVTFTFTYG